MNDDLTKIVSKKFKGELTLKMLEFLVEKSSALEEALEFFLWSRFRSGGMSREIFSTHFKKERIKERAKREIEFIFKEKRKVVALIQQLQKSGLVKNEGGSKRALWAITQKGIDKISRLKERFLKSKNKPILPSKNYPIRPSKQTIIISFDIEESRKEKRVWLRDVLKNLDYKMLQKSVWLGTNQLSKNLIKDLEKLDILKNVKIFSVVEKGNICE